MKNVHLYLNQVPGKGRRHLQSSVLFDIASFNVESGYSNELLVQLLFQLDPCIRSDARSVILMQLLVLYLLAFELHVHSLVQALLHVLLVQVLI